MAVALDEPWVLSPTRPLGYGETMDLVTQWKDGDVLRIRAREERGFSPHDWLLLKCTLSQPVQAGGNQLVAQVLATRRGYEKLGYDARQDMVWVTVPRWLTQGEEFVMYREPGSWHHVGIEPRFVIRAVESAGLDW